MRVAIVGLAIAVEVAGWRLVAAGRASVWRLMTVVFAIQAGIALALGGWALTGTRGWGREVGIGAAVGIALYGATRAFVAVAVAWSPFRRDVRRRYQGRSEVALPTALVLGVCVAVPGEELFWRGLVQSELVGVSTAALAAIGAWVGYVLVNAASGSLVFLAGGIVGGAVWGGLAWWSGAVTASLACHTVWLVLMLAFPPRAGRGMMRA
jgi:membrane protease YdiL (CAAX protease family)